MDQVKVLSDRMITNFGVNCSCSIKGARILRCAIIVVDKSDKIIHTAYMPSLGEVPNYSEMLAAASATLAVRR